MQEKLIDLARAGLVQALKAHLLGKILDLEDCSEHLMYIKES